jgi:hypothetical protein
MNSESIPRCTAPPTRKYGDHWFCNEHGKRGDKVCQPAPAPVAVTPPTRTRFLVICRSGGDKPLVCVTSLESMRENITNDLVFGSGGASGEEEMCQLDRMFDTLHEDGWVDFEDGSIEWLEAGMQDEWEGERQKLETELARLRPLEGEVAELRERADFASNEIARLTMADEAWHQAQATVARLRAAIVEHRDQRFERSPADDDLYGKTIEGDALSAPSTGQSPETSNHPH